MAAIEKSKKKFYFRNETNNAYPPSITLFIFQPLIATLEPYCLSERLLGCKLAPGMALAVTPASCKDTARVVKLVDTRDLKI